MTSWLRKLMKIYIDLELDVQTRHDLNEPSYEGLNVLIRKTVAASKSS